ncbi:MAG: TVP38/TMEM64 family protein [Lachnospiraceae bacterium]|nr:TVP38/TMEM64 family protein [Lachnospiraceae bacterium]
MTDKNRIKGACIIAVIILILGVIFFLAKDTLIVFLKDPEAIRKWVAETGIWSYLGFFLIVVLQVSTIVIPGGVTQIATGYAFGAVKGILICALGSVGGSMINYFIGKRFGVKLVELFVSEETMKKLDFSKSRKKRVLMFALYVLPGAPKDVMSYFAGVANVGWWKWMLLTFFGRFPSAILSVYSGDALQGGNYKAAIIAIIIMIVLGIIGKLVYDRLSDKA